MVLLCIDCGCQFGFSFDGCFGVDVFGLFCYGLLFWVLVLLILLVLLRYFVCLLFIMVGRFVGMVLFW